MNERDSQSPVKKRVEVLYLVVVIAGLIYGARLFYIQIVKHDEYKQIALAEHQVKFTIPADRGVIYAKDGDLKSPLVLNESLGTIYADTRFVEDKTAVAKTLAEIIGGSAKEYEESMQVESPYVVLAKRVSEEKTKAILEAGLKGIGITDQSYRAYPQGSLASQLIGFVNDENQGQYGLEAYYDSEFKGEDGRMKAVTDIYGIPLATSDDNVITEPKNGREVTLTIDINVQKFVESTLKKYLKITGAKTASAVVIDPHSGAILAMSNAPTFDPQKISKVKDYSVFGNKTIDSPYETGSGVKLFSMATGINEKVVDINTSFNDPGTVVVDGHTIKNAIPTSGTLSMGMAIQNSVNTGLVYVLKQLGGGEINQKARETLYNYYTKKFGFGNKTGIDLANEGEGAIAQPNTGAGDNIRFANMSFGQGLTVTMIQMVSGLSAVLNGGTYYQPHVVDSYIDSDGQEIKVEPIALRKNIVDKSTSKQIREMMQLVVENGSGNLSKRDGYFIGGKTGTAEIPDGQGGYREDKYIGSFIGFGASKKIDYIVMVRVDEPSIGGFAGTSAAAPVFAEISNYLIDYYQLPPTR